VGMVDGAFPHARSSEREEDLAEERRLVYVAFTRAMQRLYICQHRVRRNWNGFMEPVRPSRFLTDVPRDLFHQDGPFFRAPRTPGSLNAARERRSSFAERHGLFQPAAPRSAPPEPEEPEYEEVYEERDDESDEGEEQQDREPRFTYLPDGPEEYQVGVTVLHPQLGEGVIQQRAGTLTSLRLVVRFHRHGRKTVFPRHVPLEIVEV
jgi:ATP-dependent exoDNAse (exonuclease V) beta subunit